MREGGGVEMRGGRAQHINTHRDARSSMMNWKSDLGRARSLLQDEKRHKDHMMGKKTTGDGRVGHDVSSSRGMMGAAASCCNSCSCAILVRLRRSIRGILGEIERQIGGKKRACDAAAAVRF